MLDGGETDAAIDLKEPEKSLLLKLVSHPPEHDDVMPPQGNKGGEPLDQHQIALLNAWIKSGASWPGGLVLHEREKSRREKTLDQPDPHLSSIEVYPKIVSLETAADFHRLIVIARYKDATTRDVTPLVDLKVKDGGLIRIEGTTLYPEADGATTVEVSYRGQKKGVEVVVKDATKPRPVSFQRDVMPVLTAAGCNTGSCHGSARGQDGFHLSLFGYDPKGDHFRLTREMPGRRINLALPEDSLLLTKPKKISAVTSISWLRKIVISNNNNKPLLPNSLISRKAPAISWQPPPNPGKTLMTNGRPITCNVKRRSKNAMESTSPSRRPPSVYPNLIPNSRPHAQT